MTLRLGSGAHCPKSGIILPQTKVQHRCSGVQYILQVHCEQYSVAAVYTVHAVYLTLPREG